MNFGLAQDWQSTDIKTEITIIYSVRHQWKTKQFHFFILLKIFLTLKFPFRVRVSVVIVLNSLKYQGDNQLEKVYSIKGQC